MSTQLAFFRPLELLKLACLCLTSIVGVSAVYGDTKQSDACLKLSLEYKASISFSINPMILETETFYSSRYDSCVYAELAVVEPYANIVDLTKNIYRDCPGRSCNLMHCDEDGIDSIILDRLAAYNGLFWNRRYADYLDDGKGGMPRTLKTPDAPYTREQCEEIYLSWMSKLRD